MQSANDDHFDELVHGYKLIAYNARRMEEKINASKSIEEACRYLVEIAGQCDYFVRLIEKAK